MFTDTSVSQHTDKPTHHVVVSTPLDHEGWTRIVVADTDYRTVAEILVSDIGDVLSVDGDLIGGAAYLSGGDAAKLTVDRDAPAFARFTGARFAFGLSRATE